MIYTAPKVVRISLGGLAPRRIIIGGLRRVTIGGVIFEEWTEITPVKVVATLTCTAGDPPPRATLTLDGVSRTATLRPGQSMSVEKTFTSPGTYRVTARGVLSNAAGTWSDSKTVTVTVTSETKRRRIGVAPTGRIAVTTTRLVGGPRPPPGIYPT